MCVQIKSQSSAELEFSLEIRLNAIKFTKMIDSLNRIGLWFLIDFPNVSGYLILIEDVGISKRLDRRDLLVIRNFQSNQTIGRCSKANPHLKCP